MRNRIRIIGALLTAALVGFGPANANADVMARKSSKKVSTKKVSTKKTPTKKKATKKSAGTKGGATAVPEPGTAVLMGTGLAAVVIAQKLGRRKKKPH